MKRLIALATVAACVTAGSPGMAATVVKVVTIDLKSATGVSATPTGITAVGAVFDPVVINDNDVLDLTINFAGSETLTVAGGVSFIAKLRATSGTPLANIVQNGILSLIGTNPLQSSDPSAPIETDGTNTAGEFIDADAQFSQLGDPVNFSGLHYVGSIDYLDNISRSYNLPSMTVSGSSVTVNGSATAAVPEPATWAMMLFGFGGIGTALRSRRGMKVTFA